MFGPASIETCPTVKIRLSSVSIPVRDTVFFCCVDCSFIKGIPPYVAYTVHPSSHLPIYSLTQPFRLKDLRYEVYMSNHV